MQVFDLQIASTLWVKQIKLALIKLLSIKLLQEQSELGLDCLPWLFVMLNFFKCTSILINFYPANLQHSSYKHVLKAERKTVRTMITDQMARGFPDPHISQMT